MSNVTIKNTQTSILDLTPARDVYDVIVVLAPSGTPGDSREITEEMANDDVVQRVMSAGWVTTLSSKTVETITTAATETLDVRGEIPASESVAVAVVEHVGEPIAEIVSEVEPITVVEPVAEADVVVPEPDPLPATEIDSEKPVASHSKASRHSRK